MWLRLWRDKGAFVLAFILPGFIFAIFAAIFSSASGGKLDLRVSMAVTSQAPGSLALAQALEAQSELTLTTSSEWGLLEINDRVRLGQDDVGVVIFGDVAADAPAITIVKDPSRDVAATVLMGQIRQALTDLNGVNSRPLFDQISALPGQDQPALKDPSVSYYIGAIAILFLLFSAMQGAALSLEERRSGISDRLLMGPKGALLKLAGKALFLTLVGTLQAAVILAAAQILFHVPLISHVPALTLACVGTAFMAASIALLVATLCSSPAQMNAVSTFIVLLFSAVGGSMVPRFMMPEWLQSVGVFTPNHWAIESVYGTLAREQSIQDLAPVYGVLFGIPVLCLALAAIIAHRLGRS